MNALANAQKLVKDAVSALDIDHPSRNVIKEGWDRLSRVPGGTRVFSRMIGFAARYTGTIRAHVVELSHRRSLVEMNDGPLVRNHLRSVHAVALVNLAELAGNVALSYSLPPDARFIVAGLSMDYLKKARGKISAEGICPEILTSARQEYEVVVTLRDAAGDTVARCTLRTLVGPKPPRT